MQCLERAARHAAISGSCHRGGNFSPTVLQGTLAAALDFYTKGELLEGDNQYFCEAVGKKARRHFLCRICASAACE